MHERIAQSGWIILVLACVGLGLATALAQEELPTDRLLRTLQPTADVNDFAGLLAPADKAALEERCRQLREKTGAQLAVVVVKSLEGGQIDDFTVKLFARWGIGEKEKMNGVLLLVAIDDRKARIEVGYGLEPILPDALAGRVLNDQLFPAFRQQRYAEGLTAAVSRIAEIVERNEPAPQPKRRQNDNFLAIAILGFFIFFGASLLGTGLRNWQTALIVAGAFLIGIPFLIGCVAAFPWAPIIHAPLGFFLTLFAWMKDDDSGPRRRRRSGVEPWTWDSGWSGGAWTSSGGGWSSGGGFSGGGSSWGGFSGGSSGGGGASGGW